MARIPEEEIEQLKAEVSLERLVGAAGIELARYGADLLGLCPFHDDHEPSLVISPKKNLWHCLGACATGGSVIDWVMRSQGVSFRHAVELLRDGRPSSGPISGPAPQRSSVRKLASPIPTDLRAPVLNSWTRRPPHPRRATDPGDAWGILYLPARQIVKGSDLA